MGFPKVNAPGTVNGIDYSGHALDQMASDGIMPSVVQNAVDTAPGMIGKARGTTAFHDVVNNITVITNTSTGRVITVSRCIIRQ